MSDSFNQNPFFILAVLTFIAAVAGFIVYDTMEDARKQQNAYERFVPVQAKVLESDIKSSTRNNRTSYRPAIRYRYVVDGQGYKRRSYTYFEGSSRNKSEIEEIVAAFPVGASVTAYIDPDNPKRAILDNSKPDTTMFTIFIVVFSSVYLWIVFVLARQFLSVRNATSSLEEG
ncbi:MAG: DUF3592 domain-containing protein [Alphaproteobacteria bacterium]